MKLTAVKINFRAFGLDNLTHKMYKPEGYNLQKAIKYIERKYNCKTAVVYSIEIDGQIILNTEHEPFRIVGKVSEKFIKNK